MIAVLNPSHPAFCVTVEANGASFGSCAQHPVFSVTVEKRCSLCFPCPTSLHTRSEVIVFTAPCIKHAAIDCMHQATKSSVESIECGKCTINPYEGVPAAKVEQQAYLQYYSMYCWL